MDPMGTQKPLGINSSVPNRSLPSRSPTKRSRARKSFDRIETKNKGRKFNVNAMTELDFLNNMNSPSVFNQSVQIPNQNIHRDDLRNFNPNINSINYFNDNFQQNYSYQHLSQDFPTSIQHFNQFDTVSPDLSVIHNLDTSMLVLNSNPMNDPTSNLSPISGFPPFFNPRQARNMPHAEKVERWMENLPIYFEESEGIIHSDCFDTSGDSDNWEEEEFDKNLNTPIILTSPMEILFLQQKRITSLIKKAYNTDQ